MARGDAVVECDGTPREKKIKKGTVMETGIIFQIQRYCIHDGKGVRTCVFFKGCPLRCPWCHNPEGLRAEREWDSEGRAYGLAVTAEEIVGEIKKDGLYHSLSGGGVTFTGGEPFLQAEFCAELAEACKRENIDVAVETCGSVESGCVERALPYLDRVLFDVKSFDARALKKVTGGDWKKMERNLSLFEAAGVPVTLRAPLIAGFNFSEEYLKKLGQFAASLKNAEKVELLPYHRLGEEKRRRFGQPAGNFRELTAGEKAFALECVRGACPRVEVL